MPPGQTRLRKGLWVASIATGLALSLAALHLDAAVTTAAIDVAIHRDGERELGTLQSCVAGRCRFDGRDLPVEELAWLGLGVEGTAAPPPASGTGGLAVLASGELVRGAIGGISLGVVLVGGQSVDRREVRWVRFGDGSTGEPEAPGGGPGEPPPPTPTPAPTATPVPSPTPVPTAAPTPVPPDDDDDEGEGEGEEDDGDDTDSDDDDEDLDIEDPGREEDDGDVDHEIHDPGLEDDDGDRDDGDRDDEDRDDGGEEPPPREPNREPVPPCPADRPLGGEIDYTYDVADRIYQRCSGSARMWFRLHTLRNQWPHPLYTTWISDAVVYRVTNHGCTDLPDPSNQTCTAPAQPEVRGREVYGEVGPFGVDLIGARAAAVHFLPLDPTLDFPDFPEEVRARFRTPIRCVHAGGEGLGEWELPIHGHVAPYGKADCHEAEPSSACVAPTLCLNPTDPERERDCHLRPDRYAVVPFTGSERLAWQDTQGTFITRTIRWNVCCGCGEPPSGPPPDFDPRPEVPPNENDCSDAEALQAAYAGQLREYLGMVAQASPGLGCARARSDDSFEAIFGFSGPLGRWSVAFGGLAGELAPGELGTLIGIVAAALNVAQTGNEALEGALVEVSTGDPAVEMILRQLVPVAKAEAVAYLRANPGDVRGALDVYYARIQANRGSLEGGAKILSALSQLKDWAESTRDMCTAVLRWAEWKDESDRLEREHGELTMRVRELQEKLAFLQGRCPELTPITVEPPPAAPWSCPEAPPEGAMECTIPLVEGGAGASGTPGATGSWGRGAPLLGFEASPVLASFDARRAQPGGGAGASDAPAPGQSTALVELGTLLAAANERVETRIVPALAPFLVGETADLPRELQAALLADALAELRTLEGELGRAVELGREIERALDALRGPGEDRVAMEGPRR